VSVSGGHEARAPIKKGRPRYPKWKPSAVAPN
jgi:hypothetical protein